jgi:DNA-binding response OmpR family regulator
MAKILVIEDDPQFCQMLAQMLTQAGYEVETAANGVLGMISLKTCIQATKFLSSL